IQAQRQLSHPSAIDVESGLPELRHIPKTTSLGYAEVRVIEEIEEVGLRLERQGLSDAELLGKTEVRVHESRARQCVPAGRAIAPKAEVHCCRANIRTERGRIEEPIHRALVKVGIPRDDRTIVCRSITVRIRTTRPI